MSFFINLFFPRCKECSHSLCKPEYNPSSTKFKIQLAAYYHIPEIRVNEPPHLVAGKECTVKLSITNPTPMEMTAELKPLDEFDQEGGMFATVS